jgi:SAM-dependent methyltransferase
MAAPRSVVGVDSSEEFVAYATVHSGGGPAQFKTGDARQLPVGDMAFDAVVSGLTFNFVPEKERMVGEMRRCARRGAWIALYVWDYAGEMQMLRHFWNAASAGDPIVKALDDGTRFGYCKPAPLLGAFKESGFADIECRVIDVPTVFASFDDYWEPLTQSRSTAAAYCSALGEKARAALRERVHAALPRGTDGSIALMARAFAVRGRRV